MTVVLSGLYTVEVNRQYLPLVNVKAHTTIVSSSASTRLRQTFVNSSNALLRELKYCFPLYEGVSVVAFKAHIGDRTIVGEVKEREKAKLDFNAAVAQGQRAALLEQSLAASDVFTTSIGNVPAGAKVDVDITYMGELKHDAEVDGTRLTIPARVLPRYGDHMVSLLPLDSSLSSSTMDIVVDIILPRQNSIQKIQSPSHPISVMLGTTSVAPNAEPALYKASATLALSTVGLDQDFVLQVVAKDTGVPTAILETHPTIPNHRALMVTLVPRFVLPPEHPEIVFVVDRSGSMGVKPMELAKSALKVFLKSLPVGVKFNICSFGGKYSFLWERSMSYTQETLEEAVQHVSAMRSNYGGTRMLQPIEKTIEMRFNDMPLEIMLLTDGAISNQDQLFNYLNEQVAAATSSLRVFTLGVGSGASHALIEGVAKAGRGFSQAVSDGEKMDDKIVRMLKGALSPHITDYTLKLKHTSTAAKDGERSSSADEELELIEHVEEYLKIGDEPGSRNRPETPKKSISLFDTSVDLDGDISMQNDATDPTGQGRYAHLPPLPPPRLLQIPSEIPPLYAFNRTTVYLLMGPECSHRTPKSVVLRGTSKHGPLELEIPIQVLEEKGELIHQLAAKKAIAELEQGRGWLKFARDRFTDERIDSKYEGRLDEMIEREAVRLGVQFQIGGKWCSFVAVEKRGGEVGEKKRERQQKKAKAKDKATEKVTTADMKEEKKEDATQPKGDNDGELESESEGDDDWDDCDSSPPIYIGESITTAAASTAQVLKTRAPALAAGYNTNEAGALGHRIKLKASPQKTLFPFYGPQPIQRASNFSIDVETTVKATVDQEQERRRAYAESYSSCSAGSATSLGNSNLRLEARHMNFRPSPNMQYSHFTANSPSSPWSTSAAPPMGGRTFQKQLKLKKGAPVSSTSEDAFTLRSYADLSTQGRAPPPPPPVSPVAFSQGPKLEVKYGASRGLHVLKSTLPTVGSTDQSLPASGEDNVVAAPLSRQRAPCPKNTSDGFEGQLQSDFYVLSDFPSESDATVIDHSDPLPKSADTPLSLPAQPLTFGGFGSTALPSQSAFGGFGSAAPPSQSAFGGFGSAAPPSQSAFGGFGSTAPPLQSAFGGFGGAAPPSQSAFGGFGSAAPPFQSALGDSGSAESSSSQPTFGRFGGTAPSTQAEKWGFDDLELDGGDGAGFVCNPPPSALPSAAPTLPRSAVVPKSQFTLGSNNFVSYSAPARPPSATPPVKQLPPLEVLIDLQTFSGFWEVTSELATAVGISLTLLHTEGVALGYNTNEELRILATALAISYFENKLAKDCNTWELVVDKAKGWLLTTLQGNQDKVDELFAKVASLFP